MLPQNKRQSPENVRRFRTRNLLRRNTLCLEQRMTLRRERKNRDGRGNPRVRGGHIDLTILLKFCRNSVGVEFERLNWHLFCESPAKCSDSSNCSQWSLRISFCHGTVPWIRKVMPAVCVTKRHKEHDIFRRQQGTRAFPAGWQGFNLAASGERSSKGLPEGEMFLSVTRDLPCVISMSAPGCLPRMSVMLAASALCVHTQDLAVLDALEPIARECLSHN